MNKKKYLMMHEQLGTEPIPEEMPADYDDFSLLVQQAISIYSMLPDIYEGFSGTFFGKQYSLLPYLAHEVYKIEDHAQLMQYIMLINSIVSSNRAEKQKQEQRKNKRKK